MHNLDLMKTDASVRSVTCNHNKDPVMTEFRVNYDELDWEDPCVPYGAKFKGKKFSGIASKEFRDSLYEEWCFIKGIVNGRNFLYDKTTQELLKEEFYENGTPIKTHFKWVGNRSFKHIKSYVDGLLVFAKIEDENGKLLLHYDRETMKLTEWFNNGVKSSEKNLESTNNLYKFKKEQFWNENGVWLMTITDKVNYQFNDYYLMENSDKLYTEQEEKVFIHFSESLLSNNFQTGLSFLKRHIRHINPFFRFQVARLLGKTNDINSIPFLEELLHDDLQPTTNLKIEWDGTGSSKKTEYSISKMAEIAIENIKNKTKGSS